MQVPSSRVSTVNIVYNTLFPAAVAANYVRPGETASPDLDLTVAKRTLWFSPIDNAIHAYNAEGRVFVEFLGAIQSDGLSRQFLGYEIVEVVKEVVPRTERISIGDELPPINGESGLVAAVIAGTADGDGRGRFCTKPWRRAPTRASGSLRSGSRRRCILPGWKSPATKC